MLVLAQNLILSSAEAAIPPGTPLILWENLATFGTVTADSEDANYPASNLTNPDTTLEWRSLTTAEQDVTVAISSLDEIDSVGIARHNFGSAGIAVSVGYYVGAAFVALVGPQIPPNDEPLLFVFTPQVMESLVVKLALGTAPPRAGVLYVEKILRCERGVDMKDFTPPRFGRKTEVVTGRSARGDYLGRIVLNEMIDGVTVDFRHFLPDWYRTYFDPFVRAAQDDRPFFYAWSPVGYPYEVAFCWLTDDPMPMLMPATGRFGVQLKLGGIIE